jgi:hypothetical protein
VLGLGDRFDHGCKDGGKRRGGGGDSESEESDGVEMEAGGNQLMEEQGDLGIVV